LTSAFLNVRHKQGHLRDSLSWL